MPYTQGTMFAVRGQRTQHDLIVNDYFVAMTPGGITEDGSREWADAERIAACWNYCISVDTESLIKRPNNLVPVQLHKVEAFIQALVQISMVSTIEDARRIASHALSVGQ